MVLSFFSKVSAASTNCPPSLALFYSRVLPAMSSSHFPSLPNFGRPRIISCCRPRRAKKNRTQVQGAGRGLSREKPLARLPNWRHGYQDVRRRILEKFARGSGRQSLASLLDDSKLQNSVRWAGGLPLGIWEQPHHVLWKCASQVLARGWLWSRGRWLREPGAHFWHEVRRICARGD